MNHRGAAGRREPPLSAWEKWERLKWPRNDKSAEQQGQVPPVSACSLMWNSCRQGLTSCVLTHETHFRDDGSTPTLPVAFLKLTAGEMKLLTINHLLLPLILMRTLFMQLLLPSVSLTYIIHLRFACIECVISNFFLLQKDSPSKPSVAELAGRLKGHILPMTTTNNGVHDRIHCFSTGCFNHVQRF